MPALRPFPNLLLPLLWGLSTLALAQTPAPSLGPNLLPNGDFAQGHSGWTGFVNLVDSWTPQDDLYVGQPLSNLHLVDGAARFEGFYERSEPGTYHYRLAPPKPHLSQVLTLAAGHYQLSWDDSIGTHGLNAAQGFEVLLDGQAIYTQPFWTASGALASGHRVLQLDIAAGGHHSLSLGLNQPGFTVDHVYLQWANRIAVDNLSLQAVTAPVPEPAAATLLLAGLGLLAARLQTAARRPVPARLRRQAAAG